MVVISNRIQVVKGHEKEFEARFEGRAGLVEKMPGFIRLEVLRPITSDYYVILTYWETKEAFQAWTESREFAEAHKISPRAEIFTSPNIFEVYEVIQLAERPTA